MMRDLVAKLLSFAFCQLRALFKAVFDDRWDEFKASVVLNALEIYFAFSIFNLISLVLKPRSLSPTGCTTNTSSNFERKGC